MIETGVTYCVHARTPPQLPTLYIKIKIWLKNNNVFSSDVLKGKQ